MRTGGLLHLCLLSPTNMFLVTQEQCWQCEPGELSQAVTVHDGSWTAESMLPSLSIFLQESPSQLFPLSEYWTPSIFSDSCLLSCYFRSCPRTGSTVLGTQACSGDNPPHRKVSPALDSHLPGVTVFELCASFEKQ